jgi:hypothetical protein
MKTENKHSINVDADSNELTLYLNSEFGYSIHTFDLDRNGVVKIPDVRKFALIAQVMGMTGTKLLKQMNDKVLIKEWLDK